MRWAMVQPEVLTSLRDSLQLENQDELEGWTPTIAGLIRMWMTGRPYQEIATSLKWDVNSVLHVLSQFVGFSLQSLLEQAVSLLAYSLHSDGQELSGSVARFPDHLRFGVWTAAGSVLAEAGVRHRRAYVALGDAWESSWAGMNDRNLLAAHAREAIVSEHDDWPGKLGRLVLEHTLADLDRIINVKSRPE
jgi:hypothetical protein